MNTSTQLQNACDNANEAVRAAALAQKAAYRRLDAACEAVVRDRWVPKGEPIPCPMLAAAGFTSPLYVQYPVREDVASEERDARAAYHAAVVRHDEAREAANAAHAASNRAYVAAREAANAA